MRGRPSVWLRAHRLAMTSIKPREDPLLRRLAVDLAAELDIDPALLLAEAEAFAVQCRVAGAHTREAVIALAGGEMDIDPAQLRSDLAAVERRWGHEGNGWVGGTPGDDDEEGRTIEHGGGDGRRRRVHTPPSSLLAGDFPYVPCGKVVIISTLVRHYPQYHGYS